jgi:hypothetical protein
MHFPTKAIVLAIALSVAATAQASGDDMFSFSGFGTLGVAHSTLEGADVTPDVQSERGVGASHSTTARLDSRFALQLDARFTDDLTAVVQAVSEYAVTESYSPQIALAHLKYRINPNLSLRLGRITAPLYMLSEYQRVGYAFPGVRQPNEVYNYLIAMDGIEGTYTFTAGESVIAVQAFAGEVNSEIADVQDMRGVSVTLDHGDTTWRIGHVRGEVNYATPAISQLFDLYASLPSPQLRAIADRLDPRDMTGKFNSIGFRHDPGTWFVRAEVIEIDYAPSMNGTTRSGYVNAGIRRGAWTPSVTFSHLDTSDLAFPGAADPIGGLNYIVARNNNSRHAVTAALRWDFKPQMAAKIEASHINNHAGSYGTLGNPTAEFAPGGSYNLLSASIDFVF